MKKISLILSFLCLSWVVVAQDSPKSSFWGIGFGLNYANFDKLNNLLQSEAGFPSVNNFMAPSVSFVWATQSERYVNLITGSIMGNRNSQNNFTTATMAGSSKVMFGYDVLNKEAFSVYPLLAVGFANARVNIAQQTTPNTINNYLNLPPTEKTLNYESSITLGAAIGGNYKFKSSLTLGFLTGYNYPLGQGRWRVEGQRLEDRLRTNVEGFYFKVFIGNLYR